MDGQYQLRAVRSEVRRALWLYGSAAVLSVAGTFANLEAMGSAGSSLDRVGISVRPWTAQMAGPEVTWRAVGVEVSDRRGDDLSVALTTDYGTGTHDRSLRVRIVNQMQSVPRARWGVAGVSVNGGPLAQSGFAGVGYAYVRGPMQPADRGGVSR